MRPFFFQRSTIIDRSHRLWSTNTGHNVFTLSVNQIFTVVNVFTGSRVKREANTCCTIVTGITEYHGLNVNGCTPVARNVVQFTVSNSTSSHPRTEHCTDTCPQLIPRILWNNFTQFFTDSFVLAYQFFQIFGCHICIRSIAFRFFHIFQSFFVQINVCTQNNV